MPLINEFLTTTNSYIELWHHKIRYHTHTHTHLNSACVHLSHTTFILRMERSMAFNILCSNCII